MSEFVTVNEAARLLGVSRQAIGRRIATGRLQAHPAEWDRRQRLLHRADVERLAQPQAVRLRAVRGVPTDDPYICDLCGAEFAELGEYNACPQCSALIAARCAQDPEFAADVAAEIESPIWLDGVPGEDDGPAELDEAAAR